MAALTLNVKDLDSFNIIYSKLTRQKRLTHQERASLINFLWRLPSSAMLLNTKIPIDEKMDVHLLDLKKAESHLLKWFNLFNVLPKYFGNVSVKALWIDLEERDDFWQNNKVIEVIFFPPAFASKMGCGSNNSILLNLHADSTAHFDIRSVDHAEQYPHLYNFTGNWKDAYILLIETLEKGWPMQEFPEELNPFLKK